MDLRSLTKRRSRSIRRPGLGGALAACLLLPACVESQSFNDASYVGRPYDLVRRELVSKNMSPANRVHTVAESFCSDGFCSRYPEVIECAGTGVRPCRFDFVERGSNAHYVVTTTGEVAMTVNSVRLAAPADLDAAQ